MIYDPFCGKTKILTWDWKKKILLAIYVKKKMRKKNHVLQGNEKEKKSENENFSQKKWI